jgi:hypothetical protein
MACFANRWHVSPTDCALAGCIVATVRPKSPWRTSEPGEEARRRSRPICDRASSINRFRGRISAWPISWPNCYRVEIANVGNGKHRRPQPPRAVRNETYLPHHPRAPIATYQALFGAPVRTDRPLGLLRLPASIHKQPLKGGGNVVLRQLAEAFLAEQLPDHHPRAVAPRVRASIEQTLGTAPTNITSVAAVLSMHPRTLQRGHSGGTTPTTRLRRAACRHRLFADALGHIRQIVTQSRGKFPRVEISDKPFAQSMLDVRAARSGGSGAASSR